MVQSMQWVVRGDGVPLDTVLRLVRAHIEATDPLGRYVLDGGVRDLEMAAAFEGAGAVLQQAIAVGDDAPTALARLRALVGDAEFAAAWADAAAGWEARWRAAFEVPAADGGAGAHLAEVRDLSVGTGDLSH